MVCRRINNSIGVKSNSPFVVSLTSAAADSMGWLMNLSYPPATCTTPGQASAKSSQGYTCVDQHDERVIASLLHCIRGSITSNHRTNAPILKPKDILLRNIRDIFIGLLVGCEIGKGESELLSLELYLFFILFTIYFIVCYT